MEFLRLGWRLGVIWHFPENSWVTGYPFTVRRKENARALQHGTIDSGDGKINGRTVEITTIIDEPTMSKYYATLDDMKRHFYRRNQRLYITPARYIVLTSLYQLKEEFIPGNANRAAKIVAEFKCDDPFFYDDEAFMATEEIVMDTSPKTIIVDNPATIDIQPEIRIVATGTVPSIKITNNANERACLYKDPQMIAGQTLIIDTAEATVKRSGVNTINNFSGAFHILEPGENEFVIECAPACIVRLIYALRWI